MKVAWEVVQSGGSLARKLTLRLESFGAPLHAHDAVELTWVERGRGLRLVGSSVEPFRPGDMVLLGARLPHTWLTRGPQPEGAWASVVQLRPHPALIALPEWRELSALLQRARHGLAVGGTLHARMALALAALPEAQGLGQLGGVLGLLAELAAAPADLRELDPAGPLIRPGDGEQQRRIEGLLDWVQRHLSADLRVQDAAARVHVSPAAFSRYFQRHVGKPFSTYVNDLRVGEACLLLQQTDRPVAEVAQRCGFVTLSHFNRQFRLRTGLTPRAYRSG